MGSIEAFASDRTREIDGVWVTVEHGVRLRVARMNNPKYLARLRELMRPHQAELRLGRTRYVVDGKEAPPRDTASDELLEKLSIQAMARTILLGWENLYESKRNGSGEVILGADGQPEMVEVLYSEGKALEYLRKFREFQLIVLEVANDQNIYREEVLQESEGNS